MLGDICTKPQFKVNLCLFGEDCDRCFTVIFSCETLKSPAVGVHSAKEDYKGRTVGTGGRMLGGISG